MFGGLQAPLTHSEDSQACSDLLSQHLSFCCKSCSPHPCPSSWPYLGPAQGWGSREAGNSRLGWSQADQVRARNSLLPPRSSPVSLLTQPLLQGIRLLPTPSDCSQSALIPSF